MKLTVGTPLWVAARVLLAARVDDFIGRWKKVLKTFDVEDVHDLRVSSQRLREGLLLFMPVYPPDVSRAARMVRKVTRLLGGMRNTDEALIFFREMGCTLGEVAAEPLAPLMAGLEARRQDECNRLRKGLTALDPADARDFFTRTAARPLIFPRPGIPVDPFTPIASFAAVSLEERLATLLALVPAARVEADVAAQHKLRIALKHYRYRLEILSFLIGQGYAELHATVKRYQEILGTMNDLDVFAAMVREGGLPSAGECVILNAIAARRGRLYANFAEMLTTCPLEGVGDGVRRAL
ncbi:MAG: CHAD domain-containing protein [Desulfuromonadales bacterium]|nr:MAG: CHAD domain-containing protein [Desulfuromonadales bacterium]